jgi:hypothetical protein
MGKEILRIKQMTDMQKDFKHFLKRAEEAETIDQMRMQIKLTIMMFDAMVLSETKEMDEM